MTKNKLHAHGHARRHMCRSSVAGLQAPVDIRPRPPINAGALQPQPQTPHWRAWPSAWRRAWPYGLVMHMHMRPARPLQLPVQAQAGHTPGPWAQRHFQQHKQPKPALHSEERLARARPGAMPRSPKRPKRSHREVQLTQADPGGQHCTHRKQNHTSFYLSNFVLIDTVRKWEWNEVIAEQNEHACSTCT